MNININKKDFEFSDKAEVLVEGYDLYITDPQFDESTSILEHQFTSKSITLPSHIEMRVRRTSLDPCSKIYKDSQNRLKLYTYFD